MNRKLVLHHRKLKRHNRKKHRKSVKKQSELPSLLVPNCSVVHATDVCEKYGLTKNEDITRLNEATNKLSGVIKQDTPPSTTHGKNSCEEKQNFSPILTVQGSSKPPLARESLTPSDDTVLVQINDNCYKSYSVELPTTGRPVVTAFCEDHLLIIVQEQELSFWNFTRSNWVHAGTESRQEISTARSLGWKSSNVDLCDENMFVCSELWETRSDEKATLTAVTYSYDQTRGSSKCWSMELKQALGFFRNVTFCILPELSVVVSCSVDAAITMVTKHSLNSESQSTSFTPIRGVINSLHSIKGCRAVILGDSPCQMFMWEHCSGTLIKTIQCPKQEAVLQWADEDKGYLFTVVTTKMQAQLIVVNLMTGQWKPVRTFLLPDTYQLRKVSVDRGKVMAVFLEGIICWDVKSGVLAASTQTTQTNVEAVLGQRHVIYIRTDGTVGAVCFNMAVTF